MSEPAASSSSPQPTAAGGGRTRRRRRRRVVVVVGLVGVSLFCALVVLVPLLLSSRLARKRLVDLLQARFNVTVELDRVDVSWTGAQRLEGLRFASPEGFPVEEDILEVKSATLHEGLLGLFFGHRPLVLEVDRPVLSLRRRADGVFSFSGLFRPASSRQPPPGRPADGSPPGGTLEAGGGARSPAPGGAAGGAADDDETGDLLDALKRLDVPSLPRELKIVLDGGDLRYVDEVLQREARVALVDATLSATPDGALVRIEAEVTHPEAPRGGPERVKLEGRLRGLERIEALSDLELELRGEVVALDLRAYQGILETYLDIQAPAEPLSGTFSVETVDGELRVCADLDLGFAGLDGASMRMPLAAPPRLKDGAARPGALELRVPWRLDLEGAIACVPGFSAGLPGISARGLAEGVLSASAAVTLEELVRSPEDVLGGLGFGLDVRLADLVVRKEAGGGAHGVEGWRYAAAATAFTVNVEPAGERGRYSVEKLSFAGPQGRVEAWGTLEVDAERVCYRGSGSVNGGKLAALDCTASFTEDPLAWELKSSFEGVEASYDLAPLVSYAVPLLALADRRGELTGRLSGSVDLRGSGLRFVELEEHLSGRGELRLRDGALRGSLVLAELGRLLDEDDDGLVFSAINSEFDVGGGSVEVRRVLVESRAGGRERRIGLTGRTYFDGRLDYGLDAGILEEKIGDRTIRRVLRDLRHVLGDALLPLRLKGTLSAPELVLEPRLPFPRAAVRLPPRRAPR